MKHCLIFLTVLVALACDKSDTPDDTIGMPSLPTLEESVQVADASFQLSLFQEALKSSANGKNAVMSPLSVYLALSMVYHGADRQTQEQMHSVLGYGGMSESEISEYHRLLQRFLQEADTRSTFQISNGIFYDDMRVSPFDEFLEINRDVYEAEVSTANFSDPDVPDQINQWVENETEGLIKKIIDQIKEDEIMFVINTLYYQGGWTKPFDPDLTRSRSFFLADGSEVQAPMMHKDESLPYVINDEYAAVDLALGDSLYSMTLISPKGMGARDFVQSLTQDELNTLWSSLTRARVSLALPKFEVSVKYQLKDALVDLGMEDAFNAEAADFTRVGTAGGRIFLSRVDHKTYLKVDEKGAEGAAVTSVGVAVQSLPPDITLDHPFLFILRDREFNQIVFIGIVENPNEPVE